MGALHSLRCNLSSFIGCINAKALDSASFSSVVYFILSVKVDTGAELQPLNQKQQIADYSFSENIAEAKLNTVTFKALSVRLQVLSSLYPGAKKKKERKELV